MARLELDFTEKTGDVGNPFKGAVKGPEVLLQGRMRIEIERSSHLACDPGNRHLLTEKLSVFVMKVMHHLTHGFTSILTWLDAGPKVPSLLMRFTMKK